VIDMTSNWRGRRLNNTDRGEETLRSAPRGRDDTGAILILAMIFMLVIGLIVGGLATWTANDLRNSINFQADRQAQYALSSATQVAIQNIRYTPLFSSTLNVSPPSYCWTSSPAGPSELTYGPNQVVVWCSTVWNPSSASTRVVTVSACLTSVNSTAAACAASPGLQTIVTFDDYSSSNPTANPGFCLTPPNGTCGAGMTINSSTSNTVNPTVTALSSTQGPLTGSSTVPPPSALTVTGTGFVSNATTVNFVSANAASNIVLQGIAVNVASSNSLSVTIPPASALGAYYVIVSTPSGSSPAVNPTTNFTSQYTYQSVVPTISSISTASSEGTSCPAPAVCGSAAGGTALTISGTGFLSNPTNATTVTFVDTANAAVVVPATYLTVNSYVSGVQTITVTTPGITQDTTYYVFVTTAPGGTSAQGPVFTFQPLTPVVASISPSTGGANKSVTITGIGFANGATSVQLIPTPTNGHPTLNIPIAGVTVNSSTTLTATTPNGGIAGQAYFVQVTTTTGGASCPATCGSAVPQYSY
jgi:trimeric autotransporter adhesin